MKYCQQCETINADSAQFCCKCGAPLGGSHRGNSQGSYQSKPYGQQSNGSMNNGGYAQPQQYPQNQGYTSNGYSNYPTHLSFGDVINICLKQKYASFSGRASRTEYWYFYLFEILFAVVAMIICAILGAAISGGDGDVAAGLMMIGVGLLMLGLVCPAISVTVRRLHDTGRSGWWYWICVIPYIGGIVLLVFMCLQGDQYENEYGPMP